MSTEKKNKISIDSTKTFGIILNMKIQTVNVIQIVTGLVNSITSFNDDSMGNLEAEKLFIDLISEVDPSISHEEIQTCIEDGEYDKNGNHFVLIHST